ncbi:MAG: DMT family transporter [Rickettsiaceae bacterium]|nr:DMT family transporter [Rickettsiaceae bacterium]
MTNSNSHSTTKAVGVLWFILSLLIDNVNDVIMKYVGENISSYEIIFFRFFFSVLTLIPFVLYKKEPLTKYMLKIHILRGFLLFGGIVLWCVGLGIVDITIATAINFMMPIFIIILARIFLNETLGIIKGIATIGGFIGTIVVMNPANIDFNILSIILIISALMFATLDVMNKKFVVKESMINMLFYSNFFVMILSIAPAIYFWTPPKILDISLLFILGIAGNLILYCLLKAFTVVAVSAVAPYRYVELAFSAGFGYFIFNEIPKDSTILGAIIIVISTLVLSYEVLFNKLIKTTNAPIKETKEET